MPLSPAAIEDLRRLYSYGWLPGRIARIFNRMHALPSRRLRSSASAANWKERKHAVKIPLRTERPMQANDPT